MRRHRDLVEYPARAMAVPETLKIMVMSAI